MKSALTAVQEYQHRMVLQNIFSFVVSEILATSIVEIVKGITNIIVFSLYMFYFGYKITADIVFIYPFLEILLVTIPKSGIQASATKLAMYVYQKQMSAAKVYTTYLVTLYLIVVIGLQLSVGMFSQTLLQNYVDQAVIDYFKLVLCCGVVSESMQAMLNLFLYAENRIFEQYVLQISQCVLHLIILLVSFLVLASNNKLQDPLQTIKIAALARIISYSITNCIFFYKLLIPDNENHISFDIKNLSPLRWNLIWVMFRDFFKRFPGDVFIPGVKMIIIIMYKKYAKGNNSFCDLSLISFCMFIQLFNIGNSFNIAAYQSLRHPLDVNKNINMVHRVYGILTNGYLVAQTFSIIASGIIYSLIPFISDQFFGRINDLQLKHQQELIFRYLKYSVLPPIILPFYHFAFMFIESYKASVLKFALHCFDYFMMASFIAYSVIQNNLFNFLSMYLFTLVNQSIVGLFVFCYYHNKLKEIINQIPKSDDVEAEAPQMTQNASLEHLQLHEVQFDQVVLSSESRNLSNQMQILSSYGSSNVKQSSNKETNAFSNQDSKSNLI
ncbi:Conserved_hypothetical protein [Hexamita inflata]|uniref:Uncharacterized protein n=1 Tax=Hexamita inflata TaxID=28002 RepID=A0AA86UQ49_9EUKA|nr:Conserved hypothetical protein [Hexamita inflata]CAI9946841.1 Conserved hypothetical protein [Hexamita inflata]